MSLLLLHPCHQRNESLTKLIVTSHFHHGSSKMGQKSYLSQSRSWGKGANRVWKCGWQYFLLQNNLRHFEGKLFGWQIYKVWLSTCDCEVYLIANFDWQKRNLISEISWLIVVNGLLVLPHVLPDQLLRCLLNTLTYIYEHICTYTHIRTCVYITPTLTWSTQAHRAGSLQSRGSWTVLEISWVRKSSERRN